MGDVKLLLLNQEQNPENWGPGPKVDSPLKRQAPSSHAFCLPSPCPPPLPQPWGRRRLRRRRGVKVSGGSAEPGAGSLPQGSQA